VLRGNSGTPLAGATVTLTDTSGKTTYTAQTKNSGEFAFAAIAPEVYNLFVISQSVTYTAEQPLKLNSGDLLSKNLQLSKPETALVVVQETTANTAQGSGGEHLSRKEVSSLPLNSRDFSKLLLLAAGTMTDANGAANFTQQFAVNGQRGVTGSSPSTALTPPTLKWAGQRFRLSISTRSKKCNPIRE
jgi:hypothetical protein